MIMKILKVAFTCILIAIVVVCFCSIMVYRNSKDFEDKAAVFGVIAALCSIAIIFLVYV